MLVFKGTGTIDYHGYNNCLYLQNALTRVVLCHQAGGRVLEYARNGENALQLSSDDAGLVWDGVTFLPGISGGRCDIGPEHMVPRHPALWMGPWTAEITGPRAARMTSETDDATGVRLIRDFTLDEKSSRLIFRQTIHNVSDETKCWCHWSRTFGRGHGICVIPRSAEGRRFPRGYVQYQKGGLINFRPDDPAITVTDDFVVVADAPANPKQGFDSMAGWFAYLMPGDVMLVKRYRTFPGQMYNEIAGLTLSIWYKDHSICELEPIGPMQAMTPGECADFVEEWELAPFPFPRERRDVDCEAVAHAAMPATC